MSRIWIFLTISIIFFISCTKKNSDSHIKTNKPPAPVVEDKISSQKMHDSVTLADTAKTRIPFSAMKIAVGGNHALIVKRDSTLWVSGLNDYGQLGLGDTVKNINKFKQVTTGVCDIAAGTSHSLILKGDGSVWAAGWNYRGEFGTGDTNRSLTFVEILTDVAAIAARGYCSMVIKRDSTLWASGHNENYSFGSNNKNDSKSFIKVLSGVCAVSIGARHTLALKGDGTLWGAGDNSSGQLGWKNIDQHYKKLRENYSAEFVELMTDVNAISAGGLHSLALKKDSTLWATGWNEYGQLGTGDNNNRFGFEMVLSKVIAIAGGNRFTLALRTDGILWATGGNGFGEFPKYGIFDNKNRTKFHRNLTNVVIMVTSWDSGTFEGFSLAIKKDGTVWGMGDNGFGALGTGSYGTIEEWLQIFKIN